MIHQLSSKGLVRFVLINVLASNTPLKNFIDIYLFPSPSFGWVRVFVDKNILNQISLPWKWIIVHIVGQELLLLSLSTEGSGGSYRRVSRSLELKYRFNTRWIYIDPILANSPWLKWIYYISARWVQAIDIMDPYADFPTLGNSGKSDFFCQLRRSTIVILACLNICSE